MSPAGPVSRASPVSARAIERATIRTWPAAVTCEHDGWSYLAAGGVTGRVNAVWPLDWKGADVEAAIDRAEAWYEARNLPPRFKLTDESYAPANLPAALARRGYSPTAPTLVMIAAVAGATPPPGVAVSAAMQREFDAVLRAVSKNQAEYDERVSIALRAPAPAAFAMIERQGRVAAIGMCASTEAFAGLFLMRTAPDARRQGLARLVLRSLLARAASWGAETAFLQVEADNGPGFALYASEGFTPLTRYSFWRKTQP